MLNSKFYSWAIVTGLAVVFLLSSCDTAQLPTAVSGTENEIGTLAKNAAPQATAIIEPNSATEFTGTLSGYNETENPDYGIYSYTLWAGKHNDAGTLTVTNDEENLYVTYNTNASADLGEVHIYVWTDAAVIPSKRPAPGHADYVVEGINADELTVTIPADLSCGSKFYISAHAALVANATADDEPAVGSNAGETAYAGNAASPAYYDSQKGAWWSYVAYTATCFYDVNVSVSFTGSCIGDNVLSLNGTTLDLSGAGTATFEHLPAGDYGLTVTTNADVASPVFSSTVFVTEDTDVNVAFECVYELSGTVNEDGSAVSGETVTLHDASGNVVTVLTDENGIYLFEKLPVGNYSVSVRDQSADVDLQEDTYDVNFNFVTETVTGPSTSMDKTVSNPETAFAYGPFDFLQDASLTANRWGWRNEVDFNTDGAFDQPIYAGAGQSDITKGTLVGTVTYSVNQGVFTARVQLLEGFAFVGLHFYIGAEAYPLDKKGDPTVAPGQYTVVETYKAGQHSACLTTGTAPAGSAYDQVIGLPGGSYSGRESLILHLEVGTEN